MKNIFTFLSWANPKSAANSPEQEFYDYNATLFNASLAKYNSNTTIFDIIKSTIILRGLKNKRKFDDAIKLLGPEELSSPIFKRTLFDNLPYFLVDGIRIYIPTYDPRINKRYYDDILSLQRFPYSSLVQDPESSLIDPFDVYGYLPFDSCFTRLIKLGAHDVDSQAFYHPDFKTIFIINDQGGLEVEIPIFDDRLHHPDEDGLLDRLDTLVSYYYAGDRDEFINAFRDLKLVSKALFKEMLSFENKRALKKAKR